jgi:hypothetical protein
MTEEAKISLDDIGIDVSDGDFFKFEAGKDAGLDFKNLATGEPLKSYEMPNLDDIVEAREDLFGNNLEKKMGLRNSNGDPLKGAT